jgi:hypothetical protein
MTALLARAAQTLSVRTGPPRRLLVDSCAPESKYDYRCDSSHRYYRRQCGYNADCIWTCDDWVQIGTC